MRDRADSKKPLPVYRAKCLALLWFLSRRYRHVITQFRDEESAVAGAFANEASDFFNETSPAYACLRLGETGRAKRYLRGILQLNKEEPHALLMQAYIDLTEENTQQALLRYSKLLHHPRLGSFVRRITRAIEKSENPYTLILQKNLSFFYRHERVNFFVWIRYFLAIILLQPLLGLVAVFVGRKNSSKPRLLGKMLLWLLFLVLILIIALSFLNQPSLVSEEELSPSASQVTWSTKLKRRLSFMKKQLGSKFFSPSSSSIFSSQALESINLGDELFLEQKSGSRQHENEYKSLFKAMKRSVMLRAINYPNDLYIAYNKALLLSPPFAVVERFKLLLPFAKQPNFISFKNSLSVESLYRETQLYTGTYWKLQGKVRETVLLESGFLILLEFGDPLRAQPASPATKRKLYQSEITFTSQQVLPLVGEEIEVLTRFRYLKEKNFVMHGLVFQTSQAKAEAK